MVDLDRAASAAFPEHRDGRPRHWSESADSEDSDQSSTTSSGRISADSAREHSDILLKMESDEVKHRSTPAHLLLKPENDPRSLIEAAADQELDFDDVFVLPEESQMRSIDGQSHGAHVQQDRGLVDSGGGADTPQQLNRLLSSWEAISHKNSNTVSNRDGLTPMHLALLHESGVQVSEQQS